MPECCAASNCKQSTDQSNVSFFRFPLDPDRCKQWVGKCRRPDLVVKTAEQLHRSYKLCSKHFETSMIHQQSALKAVLKDDAVPTIFDFSTNQDNVQNRSRKRAAAKAEEETITKKAKGATEVAIPSVAEVTSDPITNIETLNPPVLDEPEKEDPAISKAKEILKDFFKETLAFSGFSIINSATLTSTKPARLPSVNSVCAENIEEKEVLALGEDVMREDIRSSLRLARFFSILLQDKVIIEGKEQIPVFSRTVTGDGFPQKHLLGFLPCDLDSDSLYLMLLSKIRSKWGLRMEHCRGFTYLSSGSMCQKLKDLSIRMLRDFPQVVLAPSDPYAFNMWLIRSMPMLPIQNVVDTIERVAAFIRQSETLARKLDFKITASYCHIKGEVDRIKEACQHSWEYGTDAFQTMLEILEPLLSSIGEMCTSALSEVDADTIEGLLKLKEELRNFNFIITLVVLKNTLCCVSILNPSLRGIISISSTLQYTISNALKLLTKHMQEIPIFHRKWFSDAVCRAKKLGVPVNLPEEMATNGEGAEKSQSSLEDYFRETLSKKVLQYLIDEVKRVLGTEMARILRWLSLVPSYMADHNFSIRKDKVADANLNNLARPDTFYDELGCWEVKWRHASKRRILPTTVFATLKIPDIGFYPNVQSLLRVLGTIPCVNAEADVYGQYDMVLERYHSYMKEVPVEKRLSNMAFVFVNQDVHFSIEEMVEMYLKKKPEILQHLLEDNVMDVQPPVLETSANDASKEDAEEPTEMTLNMETEQPKQPECAETNKESLKSALQAAITAACSRQSQCGDQEVEYVTRSEMNEVLEVCEGVVRERILSEVGSSFFSLFIDCVVRFGETEYLPVFLRFVDSFDVMRLELLGFVEVAHDAEDMCERLYEVITKDWKLDFSYCRGQAYLGSGEVSYKLKAFACKIQETYPLAICTHCSCYSFNTWWSRSVPVASVIRAIDTLEEIVSFFHSAPALEVLLDQVIAVGLRESYEKIHELQGNFCSTWLEKHDSYEVFSQFLEPLVDCLKNISNSPSQRWSLAVTNQAKRLLQMICDFDFIVAIVALKNASSFTRELSAALQKDQFSAASQLCQISGIVATLNRVKTNIKVFHQNWFEEACVYAQSLDVQVKVPDNVCVPRDSLLKPGSYYKDVVSVPLVDHLINMVKDYFSDDHKEALNLLSLIPSSVSMSYIIETLKSKPPLYIGDLPDPDNFFTELNCWKVKWKTKVISMTIPETIFQTLRLPLMQYFANINTLLRIMCVLPSTALEYSGEVKRHEMFQDFLSHSSPAERSPCLAILQVGADFNRDLERMVAQCLKVTPKTLEGICLNKESKTLGRAAEVKVEDENHQDAAEIQGTLQSNESRTLARSSDLKQKDVFTEGATEMPVPIPVKVQVEVEKQVTRTEEESEKNAGVQSVDENGHSEEPVDNISTCEEVFKLAAKLARRNCLLNELSTQEHEAVLQKLSSCHWLQGEGSFSEEQTFNTIVKTIRETILAEVQDSPFFSIIVDRAISVGELKFLPVFVRYVNICMPKVELIGFLPFDETSDATLQAKALSSILEDEWTLPMVYCRGQSIMSSGTGTKSLRKMALDFLENYPLAVSTPSESCGLAYWLAFSLQNSSIAHVLETAEDLLQFFDQSPKLEGELAKTMDGLLNTPRDALAEGPETCVSRWKKREDFFDILVEMLEGALSCLDAVSTDSTGLWSSTMSTHASALSAAIRKADFVIPLVILKNASAPLRNCSTVFRCGNPADIICELEKILPIIDSFTKMLDNVLTLHSNWFEEAVELAIKVSGLISYAENVSDFESPESYFLNSVTIPVVNGLIEEMKFNFSDSHLKALKVLSLLPTCNPLPILPESVDKLHTFYLSDLPEPDTAEEDINSWAAVWREKYQDVSPPTSISETLLHSEAKNLPNVSTLLKLVAVLPSISMECDLMKTTLNSLRTLLRDGIFNRGSKTDFVMILMHRQTLQSLEEVIEKCMQTDPESHRFLAQTRASINHLRMESEVIAMAPQEIAVDSNGSGCPQEVNKSKADVILGVPEEMSMESNGTCENDEGKEMLAPHDPERPSSPTCNNSSNAADAAEVILTFAAPPSSTSEQPAGSNHDCSMESRVVQHDETDHLKARAEDVNDRSEAHGRCRMTQFEGTNQSEAEVEEDQRMEIDQFVAPEIGGAGQLESEEQNVPDQSVVGHMESDLSREGQSDDHHTEQTQGQLDDTENQSESVHMQNVQVYPTVNREMVLGNHEEVDQVMEFVESGHECETNVRGEQKSTSLLVSGELSEPKHLPDGRAESEQSVMEGPNEGCLAVDRTHLSVSANQNGSDIVEAENSQSAASVQFEGESRVEGEVKETESRVVSDVGIETVSDQSHSEQLEVRPGNDPSIIAHQSEVNQSELVEQSEVVPFLAVDQIETENFTVDGQTGVRREELMFTNERAADSLVADDPSASDQLMLVESGNELSVPARQLTTGDQSVPEHFVAVGQIEMDGKAEPDQAEASLSTEGGSDQLMVVDNFAIEESAHPTDQSPQIVSSQTTAPAQVEAHLEGQSEADHLLPRLPEDSVSDHVDVVNNIETGQLARESDQSVVEGQAGASQRVPDQSHSLQGGADQIVPATLSGVSTVDQFAPDQSKVPSVYSSAAPDVSDQEVSAGNARLDRHSAVHSDRSTPASPVYLSEHPMASTNEGTDGLFTPFNTVVRAQLLEELRTVKSFTVVAEKEFEIAGQAYMPVGIHYLDRQDVHCKKILAFIPLSTGVSTIVDHLTLVLSEKWGLNLTHCRGQNLSIQMREASSLLSQKLPRALTLFSPVTLKTILAGLPQIELSFEILERAMIWLFEDVQRRSLLEDAVDRVFQAGDVKASKLKSWIHAGQWTMSHELLELAPDILDHVVHCLNEMKGNHEDTTSTTQARDFLSTFKNFDFILTVVIAKNTLSPMKNLNLSLQAKSSDLYQAVVHLPDVLSALNDMKNRIELHHQAWFEEASALSSKLQVLDPALQTPLNVHYRVDLCKGVLEHCLAQVQGLPCDVLSALRCLQLVPYVMSEVEGCCKDLDFSKVFQDDLPDPNSFHGELQQWRDRWQESISAHHHLPDTALAALKASDIQSFPNISAIFRLLALLPLSSIQSQGEIASELHPL